VLAVGHRQEEKQKVRKRHRAGEYIDETEA
jgi:hypothetical protein